MAPCWRARWPSRISRAATATTGASIPRVTAFSPRTPENRLAGPTPFRSVTGAADRLAAHLRFSTVARSPPVTRWRCCGPLSGWTATTPRNGSLSMPVSTCPGPRASPCQRQRDCVDVTSISGTQPVDMTASSTGQYGKPCLMRNLWRTKPEQTDLHRNLPRGERRQSAHAFRHAGVSPPVATMGPRAKRDMELPLSLDAPEAGCFLPACEGLDRI